MKVARCSRHIGDMNISHRPIGSIHFHYFLSSNGVCFVGGVEDFHLAFSRRKVFARIALFGGDDDDDEEGSQVSESIVNIAIISTFIIIFTTFFPFWQYGKVERGSDNE